MTRHFDAVLFDAGGTLLGTNVASPHWYEQFFVDACHENGYDHVTVADVQTALAHNRATLTDPQPFWHCDRLIREHWDKTYSSIFRTLCPAHNAAQLAKHYIHRFSIGDYTELFPDALPALESATRNGLQIGLVSNFGSYLDHILTRLNIAHYFSIKIISSIVGTAKPNPDIFQLAHSFIPQIPAHRILFVGDSLHDDYDGSRAYGMTPILIRRIASSIEAPDGTTIMTSLSELEKFYRDDES